MEFGTTSRLAQGTAAAVQFGVDPQDALDKISKLQERLSTLEQVRGGQEARGAMQSLVCWLERNGHEAYCSNACQSDRHRGGCSTLAPLSWCGVAWRGGSLLWSGGLV